MVGVIEFQVGDHPKAGAELHEGTIGFVRFCHQQTTLTGVTVAAKAWNNTTNDGCGIFTRFDEQGGDQRACRCFSVASRHSNRGLLIDEGSQEIRSMPDRKLMFSGVL